MTEQRQGVPVLVSLFREMARKFPDRIAVEYQGTSLTYFALDRRSDALSAELLRRGGGESPVGLLAHRSLEMVIAVVAAVKAGCGYVPLDPMYPEQRLKYMIENSGTRLLLAHASLQSVLAGYCGETLLLDNLLQTEIGQTEPVSPTSNSLAYIIYTSGSTGTPKGVSMGRTALDHLVAWQLRTTSVLEGGRTLQFSPLSFDVSFQEIWATLCSGGTLVLIDAEQRLDSARLATFIQTQKIDRIFLPFVALQALAESAASSSKLALTEVITAGEQLVITPAVQRFFEQMPECKLFNHYGPSETHVVTSHVLTGAPSTWPKLPPIGVAVDGALLYVLDHQLMPVEDGKPGELFVGGELLANGYVGSESLTNERFLTDPFRGSGRMYRTGDLVRRLTDGELEYLGRIDSQVKISGFRVELGEVEAAVASHPQIKQVAVAARQDGDRPKRLIAYLVAQESGVPNVSELRAYLSPLLPDYMLPSAYVWLDELPRTPSGKVDRLALPAPDHKRPDLDTPFVPALTDLERAITAIWGELLELDAVGLDDDFFELGGTSILALRFVRELAARTGHEPGIAQLFDRTTPRALVMLLEGNGASTEAMMQRPRRSPTHSNSGQLEPIAIVGWAGRFPGAEDVEQFRRNLESGSEGVRFFEQWELDPRLPAALTGDSSYVAARGILKAPELFDAGLFGISPREAQMIDPQQRQLLELAWLGLEDAGCDSERSGLIGVFAGVMNNTYYLENVLQNPEAVEGFGAFNAMIANEKDYVATRISHRLNLKGPSISIHTACSTSLVATHLACQSLRLYECDLALAGGASVSVPTAAGYLYNEGGMLSADGHCRAFDAKATGTTFGDGAALVVLKRLSDAIDDGDVIHAVLLGSAVNNDGAGKASFTAPSIDGQARAVHSALAASGVSSESIGYVEGHGTGTPIGDPIEVAALVQAYGRKESGSPRCALGSVKSNIGHLTAAAGVTGLLKAALSIEHDTIYPTLHFESLNPAIDLGGRFFVSAETRRFPVQSEPRRAAVSSMGVGGTNAHVILEQAPTAREGGPSRPFQVFLLSARSKQALVEYALQLKNYLAGEGSQRNPTFHASSVSHPADVAFTLAVGRKPMHYRSALVARDTEELLSELEKFSTGSPARMIQAKPQSVAFVFPGQGTQYPGMALGLYETEPTFRAAMDQCAEAVSSELSTPLLEVIRGAAHDREKAADVLQETRYAQPAIFAIEYSLAQLAMSLGITPVASVGHSVGEFVAATLAGVFRLEDAIRLVAIRGKVMQGMPPGGMLSVRAEVEVVESLLVSGVIEIAAVNGKKLVVVAGPDAALNELEAKLQGMDIPCKRLRTSHAFHTWMMEPAVEQLRNALTQVTLRSPKQPFVSTATGQWITEEQATSIEYWASHLRRPVLFSQALQTLWSKHQPVLLELGPAGTLSALARHSITEATVVVSALGPVGDAQSEQISFMRCIGSLWAHGVTLSAKSLFYHEVRRKVTLPARPLEQQNCWLAPSLGATLNGGNQNVAVSRPSEARADVVVPIVSHQQSSNSQQPAEGHSAERHSAERQPAERHSAERHSAERHSAERHSAERHSAERQTNVLQAHRSMSTPTSNRDTLLLQIRKLLEEASGLELSEFDQSSPFPEMGLDSLLLTQAAITFKKKFSVPVTFRQLSDELNHLGGLADYLLPRLSPESLAALAPAVPAPALPVPAVSAVQSSLAPALPQAGEPARPPIQANVAQPTVPVFHPLRAQALGGVNPAASQSTHHLIEQQLQLMARQLQLLEGGAFVSPEPSAVPLSPATGSPTVASGNVPPITESSGSVSVRSTSSASRDSSASPGSGAEVSPPKTFGAQTRIDSTRREFDAAFNEKLQAFLRRYESKTPRSKEYAARHRPHLADPRVVSGFRPAIKEAIYPIVVERSKGCRLWDIDGNEYIDITCGFGTNFLGHSPDFVNDAVKAQLDLGVEIGPQNPLAGEVTQLLTEMTGLDRAALCNTGSEAVLGALRLARTVTGNSLVVAFNGAYHGIVDEVIVRGTPSLKSFPGAPGIPPESVSNMLILDYADPKSLQIIRDRIDDLAAVLVEPVQSRHPDLQPREFLQELRKITQEAGVALIFDEVITGFRSCVGGAQEHFAIRADLATYGKIIGGGMPIGAIVGVRRFMDALDGGAWQFGDDSIPEIGVTYFAGTFVRHPLALAASKAALSFIKQQGEALHRTINEKARRLVDELNEHFERYELPVHIERFGSLTKIHVEESHALVALFFHALRLRGLHVWEARPTFITFAHTDEDVDMIAAAFKGAAADMVELGVFPRSAMLQGNAVAPVEGARLGRDEQGNPAWFIADPERQGKFRQVSAE